MGPRALICHDRDHIEVALEAAARHCWPLLLLTPEGAAGFAGPGYYRQLFAEARRHHPDAPVRYALDCGNDAAMALFALESGWRTLVLRGRVAARRRVAAIAAGYGAELLPAPRSPLDLGLVDDPAAAVEGEFNAD